jgi:hypothetical protein
MLGTKTKWMAGEEEGARAGRGASRLGAAEALWVGAATTPPRLQLSAARRCAALPRTGWAVGGTFVHWV